MVGTIYSGNYEVQELIAQGGMGAVYKALDKKFDRPVAIKVIHPHLLSDSKFLERFYREARDMARLAHENIVTVHDVGQDQGVHYLVMEYFPGTNLRDMVASSGAIPLLRAVNITRQVANALSYTHGHSIIHRDIKPANIMVDNRNRAKVTDFGIAAALDHTPLTSTGQIIGSLPYMPPEQARDAILDCRSDLYSLGITFYELLTGLNPRRTMSNVAILTMLQSEDGMPALEFPASVPKEIQQVVRDLMRYKPTDRIKDADTLLNRLEAIRPVWAGTASIVRSPDSAPTIIRSISDLLGGQNDPAGDKTVAVLDPRLDPRLNAPPPRKSILPKLNRTWLVYALLLAGLGVGVGTGTYMYSTQGNSMNVVVVSPPVSKEPQVEQKTSAPRKPPADMNPTQNRPRTPKTPVQTPASKLPADKASSPTQVVPEKAAGEKVVTGQAATVKAATGQAAGGSTADQANVQASAEVKPLETSALDPSAADRIAALRKKALTNLLNQVQRLMVRKDLAGLEQISDLSENRRRLLQNLFQEYSEIDVSVGEVVEGPNEANAVLVITKLVQENGEVVEPAPLLRRTKLKVPRDGTSWGHVVW